MKKSFSRNFPGNLRWLGTASGPAAGFPIYRRAARRNRFSPQTTNSAPFWLARAAHACVRWAPGLDFTSSHLQTELPLYLTAAASAPAFDRADVTAYTEGVLKWWRTNGSSFKQWALAARIVFSISPNSASCERVFALVKNMFGEEQMSALADTIQSALMLRSNGRRVG